MNSINGANAYSGVNQVSNDLKLPYVAKQTSNLLKTEIKDRLIVTGGVAATAGTAALVTKSKVLQNVISKFGKKISSTSTFNELKDIATKGLNKFKSLPGPAKAVVAVGTVITALAAYSNRIKGAKNIGKTEQEYQDKSKIFDKVYK